MNPRTAVHDKFFEERGRRPGEGDLFPFDGSLWVYLRAMWVEVCKIEADPESARDIDFEIAEGILISHPLEQLVEIIARVFTRLSAEAAQEFREFIFKMFKTGGWRPPEELASQGTPGTVTLERPGENLREVRVPDIAVVLDQLRAKEPGHRLAFVDDVGDIISIDPTQFPVIGVSPDKEEDVRNHDEP